MAAWPSARAAGTAETHVPVTLFGQPCLLKGPMDQKTLKAVHAISPEQIAPPFTSSRTAAQTRHALDVLAAANGLPSGLDRYRDQLGAELKAQLAFLDGLEVARKAGNGAPLSAAVKSYLKPTKQKDFDALAAKLSGKKSGSAQQAAVVEQLFDAYPDSFQTGIAAVQTETDAAAETSEEEFHRAIRRLNIQYACNFDIEDDSTGNPDSADEDAGPAPAGKKKRPPNQ